MRDTVYVDPKTGGRPLQPTFENMAPPHRRAQVWAVGGGKGGIGKSLLSSGLAVTLAGQGKRVLLFDADLGGANLHTLLGIDAPSRSISDFLNRKVDRIEHVATSGGMRNLKLISGAGDGLAAANMRHAQKARLLRKLAAVNADYVIIDVGAGSSFNAVDFFNLAALQLLVVLPEPTSIENGYRFLRSALLRRLRGLSTHLAFQKLLDEAQDGASHALRHTSGLEKRASQIDAVIGAAVLRTCNEFRPRLVLNQVRENEDLRIGRGLKSVCRSMLGLDVDFQGAIPYDDTVWRSVRKRKPHVMLYPESPAAKAIQQILMDVNRQSPLKMAF